MATVEEHIAALRAAGQRMPTRFIRAGLIYDLERFHDAWVYMYEPCEGFTVDGVYYSTNARSPGLMLNIVASDGYSGLARMDHSRPPTEAELDWWVSTPLASPHIPIT